jgi:hypothetical protein
VVKALTEGVRHNDPGEPSSQIQYPVKTWRICNFGQSPRNGPPRLSTAARDLVLWSSGALVAKKSRSRKWFGIRAAALRSYNSSRAVDACTGRFVPTADKSEQSDKAV